MARTIWVKAANPRAQFYQDVLNESIGEVVTEHLRAETINGKQVPVPVQMTHTQALAHALMEMIPGSAPPVAAIAIQCTDEEVQTYLGRPTTAAVTVTSGTPISGVTESPVGSATGPTETQAAADSGRPVAKR